MMEVTEPVVEWTRIGSQQWLSLCGKYRIVVMSGRVIRYTASDFPIRGWRHPTEFPSVELAMVSV